MASRTNSNGNSGRVAAYIRVSKERDGMIAPELYRDQLLRWADYHGHQENRITWFEDIDFTGRNDERPAFQEMIARRGEFSIVVVPRLDRFGRSLQNALDNLGLLADSEVAFAALDVPGLDTSTSAGKLIQQIFLALAEFESNRISDGWKAVARRRRHRGHFKSGKPPWGYLWGDGDIVPDPEKAEMVREAYRRYIDGESQHAIARDLGLDPTQATRILTYSVYAGRQQVDGQLVEGLWEPIVDFDTWTKAQARRKARNGGRYKGRPPGSGKRLLTGLLFCGRCGSRMHSATRGGYACSNWKDCGNAHLSARVDQWVTDEFVSVGIDHLKTLADKRANARKRSPVAAVEKKLASIDRKIGNLVRRAGEASGPAFEAAFAREAGALEEHREALLLELARAQVEELDRGLPVEVELFLRDSDTGEMRSEGTSTVTVPADSAGGAWHLANVDERRRVLGLAIERIVTTEDPEKIPPRAPGVGASPTRWVEIMWTS